jgi:hypothetical protein
VRRAIVSLATGDRRFPEALVRLEESVRGAGFDGDVLAYGPGRFPRGCPPHLATPFAFKPFCLAEARDAGYDAVLWMDAACVAVRRLDPFFAAIVRDGHLLFRNGQRRIGAWCADVTLDVFALDRETALGLPEVNAALLGLDLRSERAQEFLRRWLEAARAEVPFRGALEPATSREEVSDVKLNRGGRASADPRVRGHRHDQSVAGILAQELGMTLHSGGVQTYTRERRMIARTTRVVVDRTIPKAGPLTPVERIRRDRLTGRAGDLLRRARGE